MNPRHSYSAPLVAILFAAIFDLAPMCGDDDDDSSSYTPPAEEGEDCGSSASCDGELQCVNGFCQYLCDGVTPGNGSASSLCVVGEDCVSTGCDNASTSGSCTCQGGCDPGDHLQNNKLDGATFNGRYACYDFAYLECEGPDVETFHVTQTGSLMTFTETGGDDPIVFTGEVCDYAWTVIGHPESNEYTEKGDIVFDANTFGESYEKHTRYWYWGHDTAGPPDGECVGVGRRTPAPAPSLSESPCP